MLDSIHTEGTGLRQSPASFILVLGQVAAKALLGVRALPANKCFWSDRFPDRVYLVDHPSFFVRGYGKGPRMDSFRQTIKRLANDFTSLAGSEELADPVGHSSENRTTGWLQLGKRLTRLGIALKGMWRRAVESRSMWRTMTLRTANGM